ncbi:hypothetical protein FRC10_005355 [Ceratobasidium sp. 414]|nr:hypothetical protein FRC10_005355 [Ceratobasidium sp. 414]
MRYFSPFAILGLLHVARGGELDAFASDRARNIREGLAGRSVPVVDTSNTSSAAPRSELPNAFKRELERRETHKRALDHLDTNKDGHIDHDELIGSLALHWQGEDNARRMLRAFGAPDMEKLMKRHSAEGDGRVSKETLTEILDSRPIDKPDYCPSIRTKVESCPTQAVLRCGAYLTAAESFCNAGVQNMIEKCIMSESCDNMCQCIDAVEDAAHGNAAIVYQGRLVSIDELNPVSHPEHSLQARQFGEEILFGMFIWAIIEWIVGITAVWSEFDNQDMPGSDMDKGSFFTDKVSICRNACAGNSTCQAFVIAPFSGNEKDKRPNCFLKTAQRQTQTVGGSTVFFRRNKNGNCGAPTFVAGVPYDDDWFSTSTGTDRRSLSASEHSILPRAHKGEVPFPFDGSTAGFGGIQYLTLLLVGLIYQRLTTELTWRNSPCMSSNDPSVVPRRLITGAERGLTDVSSLLYSRGSSISRRPQVSFSASTCCTVLTHNMFSLPQWRPTEIAYRVNGMFRNIIHAAITQNVDDPVARWLSKNSRDSI